MKLGITFSTPHLQDLEIDPISALQTAFDLQFSHIRLGTYWNQVEKEPGNFQFRELQDLLSRCELAEQPVVLTLGVKAPRWPEYYWPDFITVKNSEDTTTQQQILHFIEETLKALQGFQCITHWQIENEPYDPSGENSLQISHEFLQQEIALVRAHDPRPIMVNLWGNDLLSRGFFPQATQIADVVGIDLYPKQFTHQLFGHSFYSGPRHSEAQLKKLLRQSEKPVWITELQAEPWEKDSEAYRSQDPQSISPEKLRQNIENASVLPIEEILLWGFEYWVWRAKQNDDRYLEVIRSLTS